MKNAIIVHGILPREEYQSSASPSPSNSHWLPWFQRELLRRGILAQTPEFPQPFNPDYQSWKSVIDQFDVGHHTTLVGHSGGAGFLVRWLNETQLPINQLMLVAPWLDPGHTLNSGFFDFEINHNGLGAKRVDIIFSGDDSEDILSSVATLKSSVPNVRIHRFHGKGHFTETDLKSTSLPELVELVAFPIS